MLGHLGGHVFGNRKRIDHGAVAAGAIELQTMQHLHARGVVRIRAVGVRAKFEVGVRSVGFGEIGSELPHAAKDGLAHVANAPQQCLGGFEAGRGAHSETEPELISFGEPLAHAIVGAHDGAVGNHRHMSANDGTVPQRDPVTRR